MNSTSIPEVSVLKLNKHIDKRGFILEIFEKENFLEKNGVEFVVVSSSETYNNYMALRGLHYQVNKPQARLVRVSEGEIFDVAVDLRKSSPTFGKWRGEIISSKGHNAMFIPEGFAHGYLTLAAHSIVNIYANSSWTPENQRCIHWKDSSVNIDWPLFRDYPVVIEPLISERDMNGNSFADAEFYD